ncbi:MAG: hypothetical protein PHP74_03925 [Candidatus Gracilibacteria bacterium]|nr:hypothetical protein [Candidatus Gracilibacteria bacterium]
MNIEAKKQLVELYAKGREDDLVEVYIVAGPNELRKTMGLNKSQWKVIMDYLVFEHDLLYKCVSSSIYFFVEMYAKYGMGYVREVLEIEDFKYDSVAEDLFKLIAVSNKGLYLHVLQNRNKYVIALKARGTDFLRRILGISDEKYNKSWEEVLNILLNAVCDAIFTNRTFDRGLENFAMIMNENREHRVINSRI